MYVLYQNGGSLLGIGDTVDSCLEDARTTLDGQPPLLDEAGAVLDIEEFEDRTMMPTTRLEIEGNLYVRRAARSLVDAMALFDLANASAFARTLIHYQVRPDGRVTFPILEEDTPPL